jgi:hypothetical protein
MVFSGEIKERSPPEEKTPEEFDFGIGMERRAKSHLHIPIGDVAAIRCLVPKLVAVDIGARGLTGEGNIVVQII